MTKTCDIERFLDWATFLEIDPRQAFELAAERIENFGIESVSCADKSIEYLNMGDTYDLTLILTDDDELFVSSWGDWYEETEAAHCEENDLL